METHAVVLLDTLGICHQVHTYGFSEKGIRHQNPRKSFVQLLCFIKGLYL